MERLCSDCGSVIRGRSDKRFCDDQCRSHYNNRHKLPSEMVKHINQVLRKNHAVLRNICPEGRLDIKRDDLLISGFNPSYHTHSIIRNGTMVCCCYEYEFFTAGGGVLSIEKSGVEF